MAIIRLEESLTGSTIMGALHSPSANALAVQVQKALSWREAARTLPVPAKKANCLVGDHRPGVRMRARNPHQNEATRI